MSEEIVRAKLREFRERDIAIVSRIDAVLDSPSGEPLGEEVAALLELYKANLLDAIARVDANMALPESEDEDARFDHDW